jgi:galactose mutarotase-like enzyme
MQAYTSPDGEMGFPGQLQINVTHTITEGNEWIITYSGSTDTETVVAMTNHAYFNLNANVHNTAEVMEHVVSIPTGKKLQDVSGPPDYHLIPTGKTNQVAAGSPWDFYSSPKAIGKDSKPPSVTALRHLRTLTPINFHCSRSLNTPTLLVMPACSQPRRRDSARRI